MQKTKNSTYGQGGKYYTSLNEDPFFRTYGQSKYSGGESDEGYYYDDYEDYSDED